MDARLKAGHDGDNNEKKAPPDSENRTTPRGEIGA